MGLFDFFRKRKQMKVQAHQKCVVEFDASGVVCRRPDGTSESVTWADLQAVIIQTTSEGPFVDDIFWFLIGETGGCVVPSESVGMDRLLERLGDLPGFNHEAVIQAMACPDDKKFLCWKSDTSTMGVMASVPNSVTWLEPWTKTVGGADDSMAQELHREVGVEHVLHGAKVVTVARRIDCDDVLFASDDPAKPLAVVHLTFAQHPEPAPRWPDTKIYQGWEDWRDRCMIPDNLNYSGEFLFKVEACFLIQTRGLVVAGGKMDEAKPSTFRVGSPLMLLRPGLPPLASKIKGIEMFSPVRADNPIPILLEGNLAKSDVPIGSEIWLPDAKKSS